MSGPVEIGCGGFFFQAGDDPQGVDSMVVYVKVPGSQAGEIKVGKVVGVVDRFGGPGEGARVDIGKPEFGGAGAKATGRDINVKVKNIRRRR